MKKFIDRVEQLSKKGIAYPIGIKHYGKVGKHLEDILVENPHTKNESDLKFLLGQVDDERAPQTDRQKVFDYALYQSNRLVRPKNKILR